MNFSDLIDNINDTAFKDQLAMSIVLYHFNSREKLSHVENGVSAMTLFELAVIALSTPIIAVLCYGTLRFMNDQDQTPVPVQRRKEVSTR